MRICSNMFPDNNGRLSPPEVGTWIIQGTIGQNVTFQERYM